jgi:hypothetical protein
MKMLNYNYFTEVHKMVSMQVFSIRSAMKKVKLSLLQNLSIIKYLGATRTFPGSHLSQDAAKLEMGTDFYFLY